MQYMPGASQPEGQEVYCINGGVRLFALQHISNCDKYGIKYLCRDEGRRDRQEMYFTALRAKDGLSIGTRSDLMLNAFLKLLSPISFICGSSMHAQAVMPLRKTLSIRCQCWLIKCKLTHIKGSFAK